MAVQHRHLETLARCDAFRGLDDAEIDRLVDIVGDAISTVVAAARGSVAVSAP